MIIANKVTGFVQNGFTNGARVPDRTSHLVGRWRGICRVFMFSNLANMTHLTAIATTTRVRISFQSIIRKGMSTVNARKETTRENIIQMVQADIVAVPSVHYARWMNMTVVFCVWFSYLCKNSQTTTQLSTRTAFGHFSPRQRQNRVQHWIL